MRLRAALLVPVVALLGACTSIATIEPARPAAPTDVIDFAGLPGIRFGATLAELTGAHLITASPVGCGGPQLRGIPYANPVFDQDRLVLIWAYPPLHTPEGVRVGTPIDEVRARYPGAEALTPTTSQQYPALLVNGGGDRAYLLLHDRTQVQKLVVGFASAARELFRTGFGSC